MIAWGGRPHGAATAGVLADAVGLRTALLLACPAAFTSLAAGLTTQLRRKALPAIGEAVTG
ncbi:hypothetical protein Slala03_50260 [Streptomyces lavendulae subsp. lavendulae]|uniref:hypothetical protein n=1 Tax=Streptomyces lavendulae TaxID=1914 RepID=UPI0024A2C564|nr:hypothetical protein [Streptomyces lavendulae]GLV85337.1 hypothetical protein Slala03_50260 [Streptomyces lavendulae subsp. lavendulae]